MELFSFHTEMIKISSGIMAAANLIKNQKAISASRSRGIDSRIMLRELMLHV